MNITEQRLGELRKLAKDANLEGRDLLINTPFAVVKNVCNGIGPEWFPAKLRLAIDACHPSLEIVAIIHDLWYYFGDGSTSDFLQANKAFRENGEKIAKYLYGWYNPRRYIVRWDAQRFAKLCDIGGKVAYLSAIDERKIAERDASSNGGGDNGSVPNE